MSEIALEIKGGIKKKLVISWHKNNLVKNGISGVGTEEGFFISHYNFLAV